MKKEPLKHTSAKRLERVFRITRKSNQIQLAGSIAIINGEASEKNFQNEVFQVTFTTGSSNKKRHYSIFMSPSESISKEEIKNLKNKLGILISGDGYEFKIHHFSKNFKLSFDLHNSISIDNVGVKKGVIHFKKNKFNRNELSSHNRKNKTEET